MSWFLLALIGYLALAIVFVLDKRILTKTLESPAVYTFYSTIFMFAVLLAYPFGVQMLQGIDWVWAAVSGLAFGFAMWAMFVAVKRGEASHVNPFIGSITTLATFAVASVFLGETLTQHQTIGMGTLVLATFLLSFVREDGSISFDKSYVWGVVSGLLFAVSHVSAKYIYDAYPFITGLVWTRASIGLVGLITLVVPAVRASFKGSKKKEQTASKEKTHGITLVVIDKILSVVGVLLIQFAISLGSVTAVNALVGIQYMLMFVLVYILTQCAPTFFKERFTRVELWVETIAVILVLVGSALFVM